MRADHQRYLQLLSEIETSELVTQQGLSKKPGIAEKSRPTYENMECPPQLCRKARKVLRARLRALAAEGG